MYSYVLFNLLTSVSGDCIGILEYNDVLFVVQLNHYKNKKPFGFEDYTPSPSSLFVCANLLFSIDS